MGEKLETVDITKFFIDFGNGEHKLLYHIVLAGLAYDNNIEKLQEELSTHESELISGVMQDLIRISLENEYKEMTAFLLDYQYKHNLFTEKELELL